MLNLVVKLVSSLNFCCVLDCKTKWKYHKQIKLTTFSHQQHKRFTYWRRWQWERRCRWSVPSAWSSHTAHGLFLSPQSAEWPKELQPILASHKQSIQVIIFFFFFVPSQLNVCCFNQTTEVVTLCLCTRCMLGVFLLPALTPQVEDMNVRILLVLVMECMCAQTRPWFIFSSRRVLGE